LIFVDLTLISATKNLYNGSFVIDVLTRYCWGDEIKVEMAGHVTYGGLGGETSRKRTTWKMQASVGG